MSDLEIQNSFEGIQRESQVLHPDKIMSKPTLRNSTDHNIFALTPDDVQRDIRKAVSIM